MASNALTMSINSTLALNQQASLRPSSSGAVPHSISFSSSQKAKSSASRASLVVKAQQGGSEHIFGGVPAATNPALLHTPWSSTEDDLEIKIRLDVPGVAPDELDVKIEGNTLSIKDLGRQLYSPYDTKVQLPLDCIKEETRALLKNGVLFISVPKKYVRRVTVVHVPVRTGTQI